jgi:hypothetical protein
MRAVSEQLRCNVPCANGTRVVLKNKGKELIDIDVDDGLLRGSDYQLSGVPPHLSRMLVQSRLRLEELQREQTRLKACIWRIEEQILRELNASGD